MRKQTYFRTFSLMVSPVAQKADEIRTGARVALSVGIGCMLLAAALGLGVAGMGGAGAGSVSASIHGGELDAARAQLIRGTALFLVVGGTALGALVVFSALRAGARPGGAGGRAGSPAAENASAVVVFVGVFSLWWFADAAFEGASSPPAVEALDAYHVEVLARQFEWIVRYPGPDGKLGRAVPEMVHSTLNPAGLDVQDADAQDDIVRRGLLRLPLRRTCVIHLRSLDVIHGFNIHHFRVKQDVIPGYPALVVVEPSELGAFELSCASLCGLGHYRMRGKVDVISETELEEWLAGEEPWL